VISSKKKWTLMNPIWRPMKKCDPSSGQNGQLVHWWPLVHSLAFSSSSSAPRQRRTHTKQGSRGRRNGDGNGFLVLTESFIKAVVRKKTWVVVFLHSGKKGGKQTAWIWAACTSFVVVHVAREGPTAAASIGI